MARVTDSSNNSPVNTTNAGSQGGQVDPAAAGSVTPSVDPTTWLVTVLYYLVQSGVQIPPWVYQVVSIAIQASEGGSNAAHGTVPSLLAGGQSNTTDGNSISTALFPTSNASSQASPLLDPLASSFPLTQPQNSSPNGTGPGTGASTGQNGNPSSGSGAASGVGAGGPGGIAAMAPLFGGDQTQPFVYSDPLGLNTGAPLTQNNLSPVTPSDPLFSSWAGLLSPPLAASQTLLTAPDQNSGSNILSAATNNANVGASA
jgi:hypothetical protein